MYERYPWVFTNWKNACVCLSKLLILFISCFQLIPPMILFLTMRTRTIQLQQRGFENGCYNITFRSPPSQLSNLTCELYTNTSQLSILPWFAVHSWRRRRRGWSGTIVRYQHILSSFRSRLKPWVKTCTLCRCTERMCIRTCPLHAPLFLGVS